MSCPAATHQIHVDAGRGVVIKRFRSWDRREPAREWTTLTLLAEFAPGLAADPVRADLTADPPVIEMSWLRGVPLGDMTLSVAQADALALALDRLWNAVPQARLRDLDWPGLNAWQLVEHLSAWSDAGLSANAFLARFGLTAAELERVHEYRRPAALFWLMMLLPGSPAHHRNPPGTLERQATRLLGLLDCGG